MRKFCLKEIMPHPLKLKTSSSKLKVKSKLMLESYIWWSSLTYISNPDSFQKCTNISISFDNDTTPRRQREHGPLKVL